MLHRQKEIDLLEEDRLSKIESLKQELSSIENSRQKVESELERLQGTLFKQLVVLRLQEDEIMKQLRFLGDDTYSS